MALMTEKKREPFTDANGDDWNVFKLDGRFGTVWAIGRKEDDDWGMPFLASRKAAINEINLNAAG